MRNVKIRLTERPPRMPHAVGCLLYPRFGWNSCPRMADFALRVTACALASIQGCQSEVPLHLVSLTEWLARRRSPNWNEQSGRREGRSRPGGANGRTTRGRAYASAK